MVALLVGGLHISVERHDTCIVGPHGSPVSGGFTYIC